MIVVAVAVVLVLGPLLLGLSGVFHARRGGYRSPEPAVPWNWKQTISSALLYTLAFNLTFFIQELFLVLPKALTPGVRPTLFHLDGLQRALPGASAGRHRSHQPSKRLNRMKLVC